MKLLVRAWWLSVFVLVLLLCNFGCNLGSSRVSVIPWFYVRSSYSGYVVAIETDEPGTVVMSAPMTVEDAKALADRLNADSEKTFPKRGNQ